MRGVNAMLRAFVLAAAVFLLAGCASQSVGYNKSETATVVVGFEYVGAPVGLLKTCPLGRFLGGYTGNAYLVFDKLDANNDSGLFDRVFASNGRCSFRDSPTSTRYTVMYLAPGRHVLRGVYNANNRAVVRFSNTPVLSVAAGDILYIGDVYFSGLFDADGRAGARFWVEINEDEARAVLRADNAPADQMVVRPMQFSQTPVYQ
jgi:hypothetical protein